MSSLKGTHLAKRVVVAAGGTGGHFYPGLVLAQTLRQRGWQPLMLVRREDPALAILEREGIPACEVDLVGLPRRISPACASFAWKLLGGFGLMRRIMRDFGPQAVVGMGGYLTFPAVFSAFRAGIPRAVHESNAVLGLANRLCLPLGARLFWGLPPQQGQAPGTVTGTPIRSALWKPADAAAARARLGLDPARVTVLVFGGSQGARGINQRVPEALAAAAKALPDRLQVLHLTGAKDEAAVRSAYAGFPLKAEARPYLDAMEAAYAAADLVVCRSGASTLAELAAQRKPAVLIPYPSAAAGHQEANARVFEKAGTARVLLESQLAARLVATLGDLLVSERGERTRSAMAEAYAGLSLPAPERTSAGLADAVEALARNR